MDSPKTAPFELGEGVDACLLLHGFTGSPWELRPLGEALASRGLNVLAPLLPGHGRTPEEMSHADRHDWLRAADQGLCALGSHRKVFICGLSMGALLAVLLAAKHSARVAGLALLAPALRFRSPSVTLLRAFRFLPLAMVHPWVKKSAVDLEDPAEQAQAPVLAAFPSVRLYDLFELQDQVRASLSQVLAPTLVVVAARDRVVPARVGVELVKGLVNAKPVRLVTLEQGSHQLARDRGRELLAAEVNEFIARLR